MVKKIENYYLEEIVGEGEYGKVYKATNERTNELVAIKVIKIEKFKISPKLQECTINEIQTLTMISKIEECEHVVKFVEILKTVNNYYFVYEYCNGGTLERLIKNEGHFSESKALLYFMDMLKAFKTLTKYNIMHRDIKPGNILLHNGIIKIADFGFCKPLNSARDLAQTMLGSPIYMAPEILKGEVYTIKADIWSLGVVLYQMLFGFCPFEEKSIAKLLTLLEEGTVSFPRNINNISTKTEQLLRKMLVKDHFKRISWDELFDFELNTQNQLINRKENNNPRLSIEKKILEMKDTNAPPTYCFTKKVAQPYEPEMKKTVSQNDSLNYSQRSFIKSLLDCRNRLQMGTKLVADVLEKSKTRGAINISCALMKRVKDLAEFLDIQLRKTEIDKENDKSTYQAKRTSTIIREQIQQIREKYTMFEQQAKKVQESNCVEKYAEEAGLGSSRDGLAHLLEVMDYMKMEIGFHPADNRQYHRQTKEQLVEEYTRRMKIMAISAV